MRVDLETRVQLGEQIRQRLERLDGVDAKEQHVPQDEQDRHICSFSITDPERRYYYYAQNYFRLSVGEDHELLLKHGRDEGQAIVSSLDELAGFILACRQRLQRRKALGAKRQKVRELKSQAIIAQVKKLAQELHFDFMTEMDSQKLRLYVKLSDQNSIELAVPFKQFEQTLPHLRTTICSLRELYERGIRFKIVGRARRPWRGDWISYKDD